MILISLGSLTSSVGIIVHIHRLIMLVNSLLAPTTGLLLLSAPTK